jgi:S1-C subfamily serine protease
MLRSFPGPFPGALRFTPVYHTALDTENMRIDDDQGHRVMTTIYQPRRLAAIGLASVALLVGAACSSNAAPTASPAGSDAATAATAQPTPTQLQVPTSGSFTTEELVLLATPSVVRVSSPTGVGSGFIVSEDGNILTNYHVIEGGSGNVTVILTDGTELSARVVGFDSFADTAVLKVDAGQPLQALALADLHEVNVGEDVIAIGFALDLSAGNGPPSVTRGIVSAKNRQINDSRIFGAIQTDAAINHGNSGGPLINYKGEVVGMNTALAPGTASGGVAQNIGFAVGADTIEAVYEEIVETGSVQRAFLGIGNFASIRPAEAEARGLARDTEGILIREGGVQAGGPAAVGGIQDNDVIRKVGDRDIRDESDLAAAMIDYDSGNLVDVELFRNGTLQTVQVTLGQFAQ